MKVFAYIEGSECFEDAKPFEIYEKSDYAFRGLAEDYAEFYFRERDGWKTRWPIRVKIVDESDKLICTVQVYMEAEPQFYSYDVTRPRENK